MNSKEIGAAALAAIVCVGGWGSTSWATEPASQDAETAAVQPQEDDSAAEEGAEQQADAEQGDEFELDFGGAYSIWALNQRNFFLGKDAPLNTGDYVVQNFRLQLQAGNNRAGAVLRADAAQGWWGANNSPNTETIAEVDEDGNVVHRRVYNPDAMFRFKDTNYLIHFDRAYLYFDVPHIPVRVRAGRQDYSAGNRLVLDYDLDGVQVDVAVTDALRIEGLWAKVSEGTGSFRAPGGALMNDDGAFADRDLYGGKLVWEGCGPDVELFGLHYIDRVADTAYLPEGLGFLYSRFQPQVSQATALGIKAHGTADLVDGLDYNLEFNYLFGSDDIDNDDHQGNLLDINDGSLSGYNIYASAKQKFTAGIPIDVGLVLGLGSGDDDPTAGSGNINRLMTMGFFALTNVWEDSVMPDIAGISPQGLGSPASRGYRELENTTAAQLSLGLEPIEALRLQASYTYLRATEPVFGWDDDGPTDQTARDLGQEVNLNLHLQIYENLRYTALSGLFLAGDASALLINGNLDDRDNAWELKQVLQYSF